MWKNVAGLILVFFAIDLGIWGVANYSQVGGADDSKKMKLLIAASTNFLFAILLLLFAIYIKLLG